MNKKLYGFSSDINDLENLEVIKYILKIKTISYTDQLTLIKQFLNNWVDIESIRNK